MLFGLFITLGVAVLSVALRSYESSFSQKIGALGILTASFLAIYYITDSWLLGLLSALSWLFLPWVEILTRIRALRLPREKALRPKSPPSAEVFPTLEEISTQIENEGFRHINDAGWDWADYQQFFRLYYKEEDRAQAAICLNEQHDLSFYYLRISSRTREGIIWTTWNYPLSYGLKLTPQFRINRQRPDQSFWQLYQSHKGFLREHQVETAVIEPLDEEQIQQEMEKDLRDQIAHNLSEGVLTQTNGGEIKYSWRGMVYLWCQFLLDLVRM
ncbi:MAG TPA: hypothetical protein VGI85_10980 [Chthoniobacterales bacterium]|jgi:hypothetical protein